MPSKNRPGSGFNQTKNQPPQRAFARTRFALPTLTFRRTESPTTRHLPPGLRRRTPPKRRLDRSNIFARLRTSKSHRSSPPSVASVYAIRSGVDLPVWQHVSWHCFQKIAHKSTDCAWQQRCVRVLRRIHSSSILALSSRFAISRSVHGRRNGVHQRQNMNQSRDHGHRRQRRYHCRPSGPG